jgi:hypothetical protein
MKKALSLCAALAAASLLTSTANNARADWVTFTPTEVFAGYADKAVFVGSDADLLYKVGGQNTYCTNRRIGKHTQDPEKVLSLALAAFLSSNRIACNTTSACDGDYRVLSQCKIVR